MKKTFISLPLYLKLIFFLFLLTPLYFPISTFINNRNQSPQIKTTKVTKGNIISTLSLSGSINSTSNTNVFTSASGQVSKLYVKNGDTVKQGQALALITLDQDGQKKQNTAWAAYLNAKLSLSNAKQSKLTLQNQIDSATLSQNQAQDAVNKINDYSKTDLEKEAINSNLAISQRNLTLALQKYDNLDSTIAIANSQLASAWIAYQQASATITAPASGILSDFALTPGISIANLSNSSSGSDATQSVASIINPSGQITASVYLTEIDVVKVKAGQKVAITMDAFPDLTFSGQILSINTNGQNSSGVVSYPAIILFDNTLSSIYPNMSINASIIIDSKSDVLLLPTSAIKTVDGQSTVKLVKDDQTIDQIVQIGLSDATNTEIISGLQEGDKVLLSTTVTKSSSTSTTGKSVFSTAGMGAALGR